METVSESSTRRSGHRRLARLTAIAAAERLLVGRSCQRGMRACHVVRLNVDHSHAAPENEEEQGGQDATDDSHACVI
ncbi:hypothetical protein [Labrenzia sp. MBR-25]